MHLLITAPPTPRALRCSQGCPPQGTPGEGHRGLMEVSRVWGSCGKPLEVVAGVTRGILGRSQQRTGTALVRRKGMSSVLGTEPRKGWTLTVHLQLHHKTSCLDTGSHSPLCYNLSCPPLRDQQSELQNYAMPSPSRQPGIELAWMLPWRRNE